MMQFHAENSGLQPAAEEDLKRLHQHLSPIISEILKKIADEVNHKLFPSADIVYQYTNLGSLQKMISTNELWTTSAGYLNDALEYNLGRDLFVDAISKSLEIPEATLQWRNMANVLMDSVSNRDRRDVFVTCFSPNRDQLSQWRGYAANGYGYAVGMGTESFVDISPAIIPFNVLYDENTQSRFCDSLLKQVPETVAKALVESGIHPSANAVADAVSFTMRVAIPGFKHSGFQEENEFRLFLITEYNRKAIEGMKYHERDGILVPHIPLKWRDGKLPIREIIVGPNLDFDKAQWSLSNLLHQNGYQNVEIRPSSIPYLA